MAPQNLLFHRKTRSNVSLRSVVKFVPWKTTLRATRPENIAHSHDLARILKDTHSIAVHVSLQDPVSWHRGRLLPAQAAYTTTSERELQV
ncbi:hypothetical protein RB195_017802 [Necator americanus]|uniref:Uncharacterized protein n=1 Tax=Necator americanus TaxID=51031 RepID=A0ABR1C6W8_NECAM